MLEWGVYGCFEAFILLIYGWGLLCGMGMIGDCVFCCSLRMLADFYCLYICGYHADIYNADIYCFVWG